MNKELKETKNIISVLMNCYNGELYLRETLKSLERQTLKNFELVFVDNFSSDESVNILNEFDFNLKLVSLSENVSLGAARKIGVENCSSKYITILDTDDIYNIDSLQILYNSISSGNYGFAYGHQKLIDADGKSIGKIDNIYAGHSGFFFDKLLRQFDIPLVGSIINRDIINENNINFSEKYKGSEEFDFFLRLSAVSSAISIDEYVVNYRLHQSLSSFLGDLRYKERELALINLKKENPRFYIKYRNSFNNAFRRLEYYKAQYEISVGKWSSARTRLFKISIYDIRYTLLFIFSLFKPVWKFVQKKKYKSHV